MRYGEWSDSLYIVVNGTLQVQDVTSNVLTVLGPGDFVGDTQVSKSGCGVCRVEDGGLEGV